MRFSGFSERLRRRRPSGRGRRISALAATRWLKELATKLAVSKEETDAY